MTKGFFLFMELIIAVILLTGVWQQTFFIPEKNQNQLMNTLCQDLASVWMQGKNMDEMIELLGMQNQIKYGNKPILPSAENAAACHATRIKKNQLEKIFVLIE